MDAKGINASHKKINMKAKRQITQYDINSSGQLTHMIAPDMFWKGSKQVFSAKTGKWLGTIEAHQEINFSDQDEPEIIPEPIQRNPAQLVMF